MTRFVRSPIAVGKVPTIEASSKILLIHHHPHSIVKTETNHKNERSFPNQIRIFPRVEVSSISKRHFCQGSVRWKYIARGKFEKFFTMLQQVVGSLTSQQQYSICWCCLGWDIARKALLSKHYRSKDRRSDWTSQASLQRRWECSGSNLLKWLATHSLQQIKHYSHVCGNILEHFEKKFHIYKLLDWTHHQILTIEKTNSRSMYIYILKLINVGCVISVLRNLHSLSR